MTELALASRHLHLFRGLWDAHGKFDKEMRETRDFWYQTAAAHLKAALLQLCRVYDHYNKSRKKGINLLVFLLKVKADWPKKIDQARLREQLEEDIQICGQQVVCTNADRRALVDLVKKLREWRDNVVAHYNYDVAIFDAQQFRSRNSWTVSEIQELINQGAVILDRYAFDDRRDIAYLECFDGQVDYDLAQQVINRCSAANNEKKKAK
jgi:hypothetical protein